MCTYIYIYIYIYIYCVGRREDVEEEDGGAEPEQEPRIIRSGNITYCNVM